MATRSRRPFQFGSILTLGILLSVSHLLAANAVRLSHPPSDRGNGPTAKSNWGKMPLYFVPNRGQMGGAARAEDYYVPGQREQVYFDARGVTFALSNDRMGVEAGGEKLEARGGIPGASGSVGQFQHLTSSISHLASNPTGSPAHPFIRSPAHPHVSSPLRVTFRGARAVRATAAKDLGTRFSYFTGSKSHWKTGIPAYGRLTYQGLWPGIDLAYQGTADSLKYEFRVRPGADPAQIRLVYRGAQSVRVDSDGNLVAETPAGDVTDAAPVTYQETPGGRVPVQSRWRVREMAGAAEVTLRLGAYDLGRLLVIDPATYLYCGYIGGAEDDGVSGIAVDAAGNAYVTGFTNSTPGEGFPVRGGPSPTNQAGLLGAAFVAKVRPDGSGLEYCGYIGGNQAAQGFGIAVDAAGSAYIAGYTGSTPAQGFPATVGPSLTYGGTGTGNVGDAFVAKLRPNGTGLDYCGYIGGSGDDSGQAIALDASGSAYVTGWSNSSPADGFPVAVGPSLTYGGAGPVDFGDAFVAKVRPDGAKLEYCGYIGGSGDDVGTSIAVDSSGSAYVGGGTTSSPAEGFPVVVGPSLNYSGTGPADLGDGFVAKVLPDGSGLDYCGYIGGSGDDAVTGLALNAAGSAYVLGLTNSSPEEGFPVAVGPSLTYGGDGANNFGDAFVAEVRPDGTGLEYCGYIGGSGDDDAGNAIKVDAAGAAYVAGRTDSSPAEGFPVRGGPSAVYLGGFESFVAKVLPGGTGLAFCGYVGGVTLEPPALALDPSGGVYVAGSTGWSPAAGFPVLRGPSLNYGGAQADGIGDGFVAKLSYPGVTVQATKPDASRTPRRPGVFTVFRTGDISSALTVSYMTGGTAVPGTDYALLPGSVTIRARERSATVTVTPLPAAAPSRTVVLSLETTSAYAYDVGASPMATVTVRGGS